MDKRYEEALKRTKQGLPTDEVFPKLKDNEDERIRQELISYLTDIVDNISSEEVIPHDAKILGGKIRHWIAYLEKEKEQKPIPKFKVGDCIYDRRDSYNRNVIREVGKDYYINAFAQKMDMAYTDANFEFLEHLDNDHTAIKPAEWSEEDEDKVDDICKLIEHATIILRIPPKRLNDKYKGELKAFVKSFRP